MAPPSKRPLALARRLGGRLLLGSLWLVLAAALVLQFRILHDGGLRLPAPLLNLLSNYLAREGLFFTAGEVWLDPHGRVLVRDARLGLAGQNDAFASADAVSLQFRRRELLNRHFNPTGLEISGLGLSLPAVLSPSGVAEPLLTSGEFRLARTPGNENWVLTQSSARILGVPTNFSGAPPPPPPASAPRPPIAGEVRTMLGRAAGIYHSLAALPLDSIRSLRVDLAPGCLNVTAEIPNLLAPTHPALPSAVSGTTLEEVQLTFNLPLPSADASADFPDISLQARRFATPAALALVGEQLSLHVHADAPGSYSAELTIDHLQKTGLPVPAIPLIAVVHYHPGAVHGLEAEISTRLADAPWAGHFSGDPSSGSGEISAEGAFTPALLEVARPFIPAKARNLFSITDPINLAATATLAARGQPERAHLRFTTGRATAHEVAWDRAYADLTYDAASRRVVADPARLMLADCGASGTYEMDVDTLAYRFLLAGSLRPMLIQGWFTEWWDQLWGNFTFGPRPPEAEIDIKGTWGQPDQSDVFVGVHSGPMKLRGLAVDSLDTRIRTHAHRVEAHGFRAAVANRSASGTFTRVYNPVLDTWSRMAFEVRSDLPVEAIPLLFPAEGPALVEPLALTAPPDLYLKGELFGPGLPEKNHQQDYVLQVASSAPLHYQGFPLDHLSLRVERHGEELLLEDIRTGFANGLATGRAVLSGPEEQRWLAFDMQLAGADLDLALVRWREFQTSRPTPPAPAAPAPAAPATKSRPEPEKSRPLGGSLALSLKATGPLADPLGLSGQGEGAVTGADLARIRLLGGFSGLLSELGIGLGTVRLTDAKAGFQLDRNRLVFESLQVTGPSALVASKGTYSLDNGLLAFTARVRPFEQRTGLLSSTAGLVLTPLSSALEVELSGTLEKPEWTFTYGPGRLLRRIIGSSSQAGPR